MRAENASLPDETIAHLARHAVIVDSGGNWRWKYDNTARLRAPEDAEARDLDQMLDAIACPVMLAYGTDSWVPLPPPERLARIRQLSLVQFPGESHWLHHTARGEFTCALSQFLSSLPER
jgi:pimeloyl-ACP methyl ester carboxylesterase